ncbi:DNA-binding protein inhibitor ID-1, partial [Ophiophagus hannah]
MKGCYSRLAALVPTLPRHRRVSKVEILQHVIDYIWDLQLELQDPLGAGASPPRGVDEPAGGAEVSLSPPGKIPTLPPPPGERRRRSRGRSTGAPW